MLCFQEGHLRASSEETETPEAGDVSADPVSVLTRELLSVQQDMKSFQEDRRQLRSAPDRVLPLILLLALMSSPQKLIVVCVCVCPLRAWQKLKGLLQNWLQTSGEDEEMEKDSVCQELAEVKRYNVHTFYDTRVNPEEWCKVTL